MSTEVSKIPIDQTWVVESEWVYNPLRDSLRISKIKKDASRFSTTTEILRSISKSQSAYTCFSKEDVKGLCEEWEELLSFLRQNFHGLSEEDKKFLLEDKEIVEDLYSFLPYMDVDNEKECFCEQCFVNLEILPLPEFLKKLNENLSENLSENKSENQHSYAEEFEKMLEVRELATEFEKLSFWLKNVDDKKDKYEIRDKAKKWKNVLSYMKVMYFALSEDSRKEVFDLIETLDQNVCFPLYVEKGEYEPMCFCVDCLTESGILKD